MIGDFDTIKDEFEQILTYSQAYPFAIDSTALIDQWYNAKLPFIEVFDGNTLWRSKKPIEIKLSEEKRRRRFNDLINAFEENGLFTTKKELKEFLKENSEGFFQNLVIKDFPNYNIRRGTKLLRSFKNFIPDNDILRWAQDIASRFIQEDKVKGYLYLSVDPRDFLTLSENNANWGSCHSLDGDYRAGNLNYMVDNTTVIAYIADGEKENLKCMPSNLQWYSKKWRMLVHLDKKGIIYYSRQYPFTHENLCNATNEAITEKFFDDKHFPCGPKNIGFNEVTLSGSIEELDNNHIYFLGKVFPMSIFINNNNLGYTDLIQSRVYTPTVNIATELKRDAIIKAKSDEEKYHKIFDISIGEKAICPCCGEKTIQNERSFLCSDCIDKYHAEQDFYCYCSECGRHIYEEDEFVIDSDEVYCLECAAEQDNLKDEEDK